MNPPIHLVLSCTNRKHAVPGAHPRLRDVRGKDVASRASNWIETIESVEPQVPASELYAGEYWVAALALAEECRRHSLTQVWVISAGVGLVKLDDHVPAYAATLASGHPDSVARGGEGRDAREAWWLALSAWGGPRGTTGPRRLADLDTADGSTVIVCAGRTYLETVASDLVALQAKSSEDRLLLVSSGGSPAGLEPAWLSVAGQLRMRFGGSMSSTAARVSRGAVERLAPSGKLSASATRALIAEWVEESAPLPHFDRKPLSDAELARWIERDLDRNEGATNPSASLRRLRAAGSACEQGRFGRLFSQVMGVTR